MTSHSSVLISCDSSYWDAKSHQNGQRVENSAKPCKCNNSIQIEKACPCSTPCLRTHMYQMQQILQQVQNFAGWKTCNPPCDKKTCTPYQNCSTQTNVLSNQSRSLHGSLPHKWTPCVSKQTERWSLQGNVPRRQQKFTCWMYGECCGNYCGNCFVIRLTMERGNSDTEVYIQRLE